MMTVRLLAVLGVMGAVGAGCAEAELTLVQDGEAKCALVLSVQPTRAAREAARELQSHIERMSGARLRIVSEGDAPAGGRILVGESASTEALGLDAAALDAEQIVIKCQGDDLVIMGDDEKADGRELWGTYWAASVFLEQVLGVRWLWPGDLGTVIPRRDTITVPSDLEVRFTPPLLQRGIRNIQWNERVQGGLDRLGLTREQFEALHGEGEAWFQRHRIGGSFRGKYGHAYTRYWDEHGAEHGEWFAVQPDGSRDQSGRPDRARLCVSNPELIATIAANKAAELKADPSLDCVSISPNDGGPLAFCTCANCEAWDHPDGEMIEIWWPGGRKQHVSLTDRFVRFYSAVAQQVARECPDRYLGAYAYSAYRALPVEATLEPNIIVGFVGLDYLNQEAHDADMARWRGWAERARQLFLRPNLLMGGMGFPVNFAGPLATDISGLVDAGLRVTDFDCCYQHWALKGLVYYVLAEVLWDPDADPDALIDDYCRAGWGPAAAEVRRYFDALARKTDEVYGSNRYHGRRESEVIASFYPDDFLAECNDCLGAAREKAAGDESVVARVDFLQTGVDFARVNRDFLLARAAVRAGDRGRREALQQAEEAKLGFYQDLGISWAINTPYLLFYGF